ncbi:MAG TPA: carboxypeptidase regulatory-like domain-containing protein, partial [Pyrinomonadaceae bacterium]|nr:carboxypeptidase regulatory-like domain-containing protein [Pyrinomonadaceae bacterium]
DWEQLRGLALDGNGDVYLIGTTYSHDFYVKPGGVQIDRRGYGDSFITKLALGVQDYSVSGRVTNGYGNGLSDVEVGVSGTVSRTVRTDADGYYKINGLPQGAEVTLTASRLAFVFDPQGVTFSNLSQNETVNFSGDAPLLIRGRVLNEFGSGVGWLPVTVSGSANQSLNTDDNGYYAFALPAGGTYTVTPGPHYEFTFAPQSQVVNELTGDQTFDFAALSPPRIDGRIYDSRHGYNIGYIQVTLTSPALQQPVVQMTDPWGYFSFENLERGASYTVTPADPMMNRSFSPPQWTVASIQGREMIEFAALPPLAIHGRVADPNGNGVPGIATLSGTVNAEAQVDQWGYFSFMHLPRGGDYTVTVTKAASPGIGGPSLYTFTPPSRSVSNLQEMQFFEFTVLPPLRIRGQVAGANNNGLRATVTLSGTVSATVQADEYGFYEFVDLPRGGDYTVTPSYPLYTFTPPSRSVGNIQEDQFLHFEALPPLRIFGGTSDENGHPIVGATITLSGTTSATVVTDVNGYYNFNDLPRGGTYSITAAHELYTFTPPSRELPAMASDRIAPFQGALRRITLSGRAADAGTGAPLSGVTMTLGGGANGITHTDANGNYAFQNLAVGRGYNVTAGRPGYAFAPESFNVADPRGDQTANFNGSRLAYTVSGRITDAAGGAALAGVSVSLGGSLPATTQTDAQGNYTFTGLPSEGNYTVTPSHPNFNFAPASRPFANLLSDMEADFAGTRINYQISGRVADNSGNALGGATVTLGGARAATVQTDATGAYIFAGLPSGFDYTLTVAATHYTFSPPTCQANNLGGNTTADFTATLLAHTISGRVVDAGGNGFPGALVQLNGTRTGSVMTDATGNYSFSALPAGGNYTVEPSREFYDFSPVRGIFNDLGGDRTANFTAALRRFQIGGRITEGASGVAGVTITLGGSQTASTQTDAAGNYLFTQLPANGNYTVTPAHPFYAFSPGGATFNTLPFNGTANFTAARLLYQVGGYTLDACGRPIPGVTMSLTRDGLAANAQTNAAGFYSFNNVPAGYNYTLAPTGSTHAFNPQSVSFPALNANQASNFTGTPPVSITDAPALADTYVRGGTATSNFGTATQLIARLSSQTKDTYETYLKFDAGQPCTVSTVKLRLYGKLSGSGTLPLAVYGVPATTWTETGMNWNNKPASGALLRTVNVVGTTAAWYEWDVTDYVRAELGAGRSAVSFALKSTAATSYQVTFNSREAAGTNAPRLVVAAQ